MVPMLQNVCIKVGHRLREKAEIQIYFCLLGDIGLTTKPAGVLMVLRYNSNSGK